LTRKGIQRVILGKLVFEIAFTAKTSRLKLDSFNLEHFDTAEGCVMQRALVLAGVVLLLSISAAAQGPAGAGSISDADLGHWQLAIGYQYNRINLTGTPFNTNGLNTTIVGFLNRWFALEAQVGSGFGNTGTATSPANLTAKSLYVGGGARLVYRNRSRFEPWVHGTVGMEHFRFTQNGGLLGNNTSLAESAGGGTDFYLNPRTALRVEADWIGTRFFSVNQRHFQVTTGIVFNF
jgi:hypothetical protein